MRTSPECVPCFLRQTVESLGAAGVDGRTAEEVVRKVAAMCARLDFDVPPPVPSRDVYRIIREATGVADPFRDLKHRFNRMALALYPRLERLVKEAADPFDAAARIATAGNIIDLGVKHALTEDEALGSVEAALHAPLDGSTQNLKDAVAQARNILYLADNAGEIVLERLLIERMPLERLTVAVRGGAIINDALMEDAEEAGLTKIVRVIDNGSDAPGTVLELASEEFRRAYAASDLVISKGQGNYETVSAGHGQTVFYLLKVKCPVIARDLCLPVGTMVIRRSVA